MKNSGNKLISNVPNSYLVLINILLFLFFINLLDSNYFFVVKGSSFINLVIIRFVIMLFSIMSVIALFIKFTIFKETSLYIAGLFYFNFALEMALKFIITVQGGTEYLNHKFYYSIIFRGFFLIVVLLLLRNNRKKIKNKKEVITIIYTLLTVIFLTIDLGNFGISHLELTVFYPITLIVDSITLIIISIAACRTNETLYFSVALSIMLSIISDIYEMYFLNQGQSLSYYGSSILQLGICLMSFMVLFSGVFMQSYRLLTNGKKTEKSNEEKINFIEDNIKEIILIVDDKFVIEYASIKFKKILGYKREEIIGKKLVELIGEKDKEKYTNNIMNLYRKNNIINIGLLSKSQEIIETEIRINNFKDGSGETTGLIMFITALENNSEIEKLKGKLNEIKESEESQKDFYAELSHELRTPVNIMYSSIQLLEQKKNEDREEFVKYYNKYGKVMMQNSLIMLKLINNLIDTNKVDSGFVKGNFKNYDIVSLIENVTMLAIPYLDAKNIELIFDTELEENYIKCDLDKIERVMLNLLSNAAKYTECGGTIKVELFFDDDFVTIKVKDSGVGIPENMQDEIFKKFEQVEDRKEKKLGSGIGLALVKSLIEIHSGTIAVNSKLGEGSEFIIKLPNEIEKGLNNEIEMVNLERESFANLSIEFSDL